MPELAAAATLFLAATVRMAIPLTLAGLGETVAERSGVLNIGVEAIMLSGAFCAFLTVFHTGNFLLGSLAGMAGGLAVSAVHAWLAIHRKADQTIAGLALNFLVPGLTNFLFLKHFGLSAELPAIPTLKPLALPLLSRLPLLGPVLFEQDPIAYFTYAAVLLLTLAFAKTTWGLALTACGEAPQAADSAGLSVERIRFTSCAINGLLGGLGGAYLTTVKLGFFIENVTAGAGYIALVTVILGRRCPPGVLLAALIIGLSQALQYRLQTSGIEIPSQAFTMFPYLMTVAALLFSITRPHDPAALGRPYDRTTR